MTLHDSLCPIVVTLCSPECAVDLGIGFGEYLQPFSSQNAQLKLRFVDGLRPIQAIGLANLQLGNALGRFPDISLPALKTPQGTVSDNGICALMEICVLRSVCGLHGICAIPRTNNTEKGFVSGWRMEGISVR